MQSVHCTAVTSQTPQPTSKGVSLRCSPTFRPPSARHLLSASRLTTVHLRLRCRAPPRRLLFPLCPHAYFYISPFCSQALPLGSGSSSRPRPVSRLFCPVFFYLQSFALLDFGVLLSAPPGLAVDYLCYPKILPPSILSIIKGTWTTDLPALPTTPSSSTALHNPSPWSCTGSSLSQRLPLSRNGRCPAQRISPDPRPP